MADAKTPSYPSPSTTMEEFECDIVTFYIGPDQVEIRIRRENIARHAPQMASKLLMTSTGITKSQIHLANIEPEIFACFQQFVEGQQYASLWPTRRQPHVLTPATELPVYSFREPDIDGIPQPSFPRHKLRQAFEYLCSKGSQHVYETPIRGYSRNSCIDRPLISHVKLFMLAEEWDIEELSKLARHRLCQDLRSYPIFHEHIQDIMELARFALSREVNQILSARGRYPLRSIICSYLLCLLPFVWNNPCFQELFKTDSPFARELTRRYFVAMSPRTGDREADDKALAELQLGLLRPCSYTVKRKFEKDMATYADEQAHFRILRYLHAELLPLSKSRALILGRRYRQLSMKHKSHITDTMLAGLRNITPGYPSDDDYESHLATSDGSWEEDIELSLASGEAISNHCSPESSSDSDSDIEIVVTPQSSQSSATVNDTPGACQEDRLQSDSVVMPSRPSPAPEISKALQAMSFIAQDIPENCGSRVLGSSNRRSRRRRPRARKLDCLRQKCETFHASRAESIARVPEFIPSAASLPVQQYHYPFDQQPFYEGQYPALFARSHERYGEFAENESNVIPGYQPWQWSDTHFWQDCDETFLETLPVYPLPPFLPVYDAATRLWDQPI